MLRSIFLASAVYAWGHPGLADYQPAMLEVPLSEFHTAVNDSLREAQLISSDAVVSVGGGPLLDYLSTMTGLVTHDR
ncbi:MAG: hypothetical protein ACK50Q_14695 [Labrys sp. (in: a-proteobacteria)]|jgi:hypothetical protein